MRAGRGRGAARNKTSPTHTPRASLPQVCLAAVLAQVGAWVPAEALEMTAMDGVYVRMGAR